MTDGWVLNQAHRYRLNETERVERNKKKTELVREQVEYDTRDWWAQKKTLLVLNHDRGYQIVILVEFRLKENKLKKKTTCVAAVLVDREL